MGSAASTSRKTPKAEVAEKAPLLSVNTSGEEIDSGRGQDRQQSPPHSQEKQQIHRRDSSEKDHYVDPDLLLDDEGCLPGLETDDDEEQEGTGSEERKILEQNQENWSMLKHSLEMDNEDLLLNMLYFSDDGAASMEDSASMGKVLDGAMTETFALHSENNTPYKLKPVAPEEMKTLKVETMDDAASMKLRREDSMTSGPESKGCGMECVVCKEELEIGDKIMTLPHCNHTFHEECLSKWFKHQSWCPICRQSISGKMKDEEDLSTKKAAAGDATTTSTSTSTIEAR